MRSRIVMTVAAATLVVGLTGCASDGADDADPGAGTTAGEPTVEGTMDDGTMDDGTMDDDAMDTSAELTTADTDLGTIVVDADGMVVYQFDVDTQGGDASSCVDECAANWPPVPGSEDPDTLAGVYGHSASEISGVVGSITGVDGNPQMTLNGWPLYYFVGDAAAGDTTGQGVNDVWWVLTPEGEPIRE